MRARICGKLYDDIMKYLENYREARMKYNFSDSQVLQYFRNVFYAEEIRVYRDKFALSLNDYGQAKAICTEKHKRFRKQNCTQQLLKGENLKTFVEKKFSDVYEASDKLGEYRL